MKNNWKDIILIHDVDTGFIQIIIAKTREIRLYYELSAEVWHIILRHNTFD